MRVAIFLTLLLSQIFAMDMQLVDAQTGVIPKLAMLDRDIDSKLVGEKLIITIACDGMDCEQAKEIASKIISKTNGTISGKTIKVVVSEISNLSKMPMSFLYVISTNESNIKKAANIAKSKGVISFAYSKNAIEMGAILTMHIERNTIISLNRTAMKEANIRFVDSFYKIARIVD